MSIVVVKDDVMAADTSAWSGPLRDTSPVPKIVRAPSGTLYGAAGRMRDVYQLRLWVLAGEPADAPPVFNPSGGLDESPLPILRLDQDGSVWFAIGSVRFCPEVPVVAIGHDTAAMFAMGAMAAGASAAHAVALTIRSVEYTGGDVHYETGAKTRLAPKQDMPRWRQCSACYLTFSLVDAATSCPSCRADMHSNVRTNTWRD